ncbi:MAG: M20 family metallopeptidase [Chloroflexi bacterium]|nr:M20 family metallopeptidase [Chloroflexota bacterium]
MHTTNDVFARLDRAIQGYREDQIAFVQSLIRARSANPFTPENSDPAEPIEREVAHLIRDRLFALGLDVELLGVSAARPNVIATLRGAGHGPTLILNGHMDTVRPSPLWERDPFGADIEGNRLYGLGALDMKASLGAMIFAVQALLETGVKLAGGVVLTFVVDEEPGACSAFGTQYLLAHGLRGDAAIIGEPSNYTVTTGHRGGYRFKLTVRGEATHTGLLAWERGDQGENAIVHMGAAIQALGGLEIPFEQTPAFPERRPVFTFPTMIMGGVSINAVPDECVAYGDVRLLPGADADLIEGLIRERLDPLPGLRYSLERLMYVPAVEISAAHDLVYSLVTQTAAITGQEPATKGCGPWNDGWMFITRGIPAICGFGPNGGGVHAPDEFVELDSLLETTRILARTIVDFVGVRSE